MKKQYQNAYTNPIWNMYECEKGNRFTAVKGGYCDDVNLASCNFSHCTSDHKTKLVGETSDSLTAHNWFRNINA